MTSSSEVTDYSGSNKNAKAMKYLKDILNILKKSKLLHLAPGFLEIIFRNLTIHS